MITNEKQRDLLNKEFKVNEHFKITRGYYEDMPDPMLAWTWSNKQMEELAKNISKNLAPYEEENPEYSDEDFWATMENEAVKMGMEYYEDFEEDYLAELEYKWRNL